MTADAPPPALGELARRAKAALPDVATWYSADDFTTEGFPRMDAEFIAACSPAVILQLVALAAGGADAARLDWLEEKLAGRGIDHGIVQYEHDRLGRTGWTIRIATQPLWTFYEGDTLRAAVDAGRSLAPERPADAK